jgi:hypothetical protein
VVSIDGKTICGSRVAKFKRAVHIISAWSKANQLSLGQVKVDEKSNEITAIPKLLDVLAIKGCLVTIDAMGCQLISRLRDDAVLFYLNREPKTGKKGAPKKYAGQVNPTEPDMNC